MDREQSALKLSIWVNVFMGLSGALFYFLTESTAILLDGFFSTIFLFIGILSLRVSRMIRQPADERFHFGYFAYEPLLNAVKGIISLVVCGYAFMTSLDVLFEGGRELNLGFSVAANFALGYMLYPGLDLGLYLDYTYRRFNSDQEEAFDIVTGTTRTVEIPENVSQIFHYGLALSYSF